MMMDNDGDEVTDERSKQLIRWDGINDGDEALNGTERPTPDLDGDG